jgi:hypothetical protein
MTNLHRSVALLIAVVAAAPGVAQQPSQKAPPIMPRRTMPGESRLFKFDEANPDPAQGAWQPACTCEHPAATTWRIQTFDDAPSGPTAIALQTPSSKGEEFNLLVHPVLSVQDLSVSAWVKAIAGKEDQGGGLAWRIQSLEGTRADNYYMARWSPLEENFRLYVVKGGKRTQLATASVKADPTLWHPISVAHVGKRIEAVFDGGTRLVVEDETFAAGGLVGLWTKADAATAFDDVSIADATPVPKTVVQQLQLEARMLEPLLQSDLARGFVAATAQLPDITPRTLFFDRQARTALTPEQADKLEPAAKEKLREFKADYYNTFYGSPLAYARALDVAAAQGFKSVAGKRILDYGYGGIGPIRLLATMGADAAGVDVDPILPVLYNEPGDTGPVGRGKVRTIHGSWPGDEVVRATAGGDLDLFISKNTLKAGYIHPSQPVDERRLVKLGVTEEAFVQAVADSLKPGGMLVIYNICPGPSKPGEPFKPHAEGRCPFPREMLEKAGFEVLVFDQGDDEAVRKVGEALGWQKGDAGMDLKNDLFAWYTIARRK